MATNADDIMLGRLDRLLSKTNIEKKMWVNRDFIFGDYFTNNQEFRKKVLDFYSQGDRRDDLFNKLARLDNYSTDEYYFKTHENAFEAYKELEGLDTAGMQKKVVKKLKSIGYTEKDLRHHVELLQEGADYINWQGSRDFIDYDLNLYNSANNVQQQVQTASNTQSTGRQRRRGNKKRTTSNAFEDDLDVAIESRNTPWRYTRGENFWDKKHNRHYVYDGIYNGYGGRYVLYDREGNASVVDEETMNSFSKYKGKNPLDLDRQVDYNIALDDYEHFRKQDKIKYKNPDAYYTQLKNIMDKIDNYETEIGKPYKNFKGNKNYHKSREYVSDEVKAHFDKKNANQQQQTREQAQRQAEQQAQQQQTQQQTRQTQQAQQQAQEQQAQQRKNINQDDPASWTDDDIKLMADGDPDAANHLMKEREKARQQQQTRQTQQAQQTRQTQNNQNGTRINRKAAAWTDEEIANMADGDPDVYNELIKKRETARAQIKQREEEVKIKKERKRELKEDRKRRRQEQINSRKKNNINEKEYSSMWENLLNEQEQQKNVDDLFFGNGNTGGGSSYSYDIPDDETVVKTVEDWLESNFNNRDYTVNGNSSASDIDFWASWTDDDILQISEDLVGDYDDDTISKIMDKMIEFREFSINHKNTNTNTNTNTNSGGGGSSANSGSGGANSGNGGSSGSGGSSNSTGGSSSSTKTHLYKRNGKMRQLSHGSSKYSANTKFKVNTNSGHLPRTSNKAVKTIGTMSALNTVFNVAGAVSDYKNARREGKGVVGATLKAGAEFALGEMLGLKGQLALFAVRAIPSAAIAGADMLYKESRRMNSAANQGVFGNAQFQDTQQLATMRQSGMEMAKMANYNLQQTLMGNEATYFHR